MVRQQTKELQALLEEFKALKEKLFGKHAFVVLDEDHPDTKRYNQLFQFFYPSFRTKDWVSPLN